LSTVIKPTLNIIDGVRVLMNHGPTGSNLKDVKMANTLIASYDPVATDAYAAQISSAKNRRTLTISSLARRWD